MDADIVMSPENDAVDVACNAALSSRFGNGSLAFVAQEIQTQSPSSTTGLADDLNEKPSRLRWIGTTSMKRLCVPSVDITCKRIIMANCVVGVAPFLP